MQTTAEVSARTARITEFALFSGCIGILMYVGGSFGYAGNPAGFKYFELAFLITILGAMRLWDGRKAWRERRKFDRDERAAWNALQGTRNDRQFNVQ